MRLSPTTALFASLRMAFATVIAALAFNSPAPSVMARTIEGIWRSATICSYTGRRCAVLIKTAFTIEGVREGLASIIRATVPETAGAANEVPLITRYVPVAMGLFVLVSPLTSVPSRPPPPEVVYELLDEGDDEAVSAAPSLLPGATRSGYNRPSTRAGPREEYDATRSSERALVCCVFVAPTVMTRGEFAGESMPPYIGLPVASLPQLPAATTTTMPASTAFATAWHR